MAMTATDWMEEIDNALEYRSIFGMEASWNKLEKDYLNLPGGDTSVGPNLVYSMGDSLLSSLTVPDPEFVLQAEHPRGVKRRPIVEAVDNWLVRTMELKDAIDNSLLHCYLACRAIIKIGYDSEFGWSPYYDIGTGNNMLGMTLTQFDKRGRRIENMDTKPGMPWVRAVDPRDIVVPWGTISLRDSPWIAHRVIRLNEHLKRDPKYKNTSSLKASISMEAFMNSYRGPLGRKVRDRYKTTLGFRHNAKTEFNEIWEIHDRMTGTIKVVAPDHLRYLRDDVDALQVDGLPFVSETFVKHPRSFWSTPQAYYLGQIQKDSHDISLQATKQRRINCLKFICAKGAITEAELTKLISGDVGVVGMANTNRPLGDVFVPFPRSNNLDLMMEEENARRGAREAIGFGRNQLGEEMASSRRTAREATFVQQGSQLRTSRRSGVVIKLYIDTIRKVNKIIFSNWKLPRHMLVDNEWVRFTGEELDGDYLYDVSLSTKRNLSMAERKIEAIMVLSQFAGMPGVDLGALYEYVLAATNDPEFANILQGAKGGQQRPAAAPGALPTIPATGPRR